MIVSREYIPFRTLIDCHDKGGELFSKLCRESYPEDMWEEVYHTLSDWSLSQREMGWAFSKMGELIEGFRKLDAKEPYETGYEQDDACSADILRQDETSMTLLLRTGERRGNTVIGVIEVALTSEKH